MGITDLVLEKGLEKIWGILEKKRWAQKIVNLFKKKYKILVLGCSGVGKTQFIESLAGASSEVISYLNRTEFATRNPLSLQSSPFIFIDTPGQLHHIQRRNEAIRQAMAEGIAGVINVVAYGYHENRESKASAIDAAGHVLEDYLGKGRQQELEAVREWRLLLGDKEVGKFLITVINKADLWWNRQNEVFRYYQEGPYFEALDQARDLSPSTLHYCSIFHNFYDQAPMAGNFDQQDQQEGRTHFIATLLGAIGK